MVLDSFVQVAPDVPGGNKLDTSKVTVGANDVHRERVNISDPTDPAAHQAVKNVSPASGDYGAAVRVGDGHDVTKGFTTDAAVVTDASGSLSGKLRGLVKWAFERMPASLGQKSVAASLPVTAPANAVVIGTLGSLNANVVLNVEGLGGAIMTLKAGTLAGTLTAFFSGDGGTNYTTAFFTNPTNGGQLGVTIALTNPNAVTIRGLQIPGGATHIKIEVTAYTSGTADVEVRAGFAPIASASPIRSTGVAAASVSLQVNGVDASSTAQPIVMRSTAPEASAAGVVVRPLPPSYTRSDAFVATGNGVTVDATAAPPKAYALVVGATGTVTAWDIRLEGSLDNVQWTQILQHTNVTGAGVTVWSGANLSPSLYIRARCAGLTLGAGTNVIAIILGIQ